MKTTENKQKGNSEKSTETKIAPSGTKKNFILDTNVMLHDFNCLSNFEENDLYIPFIVLEELDRFKRGNDQINFNARAFVRELDLITDDNLYSGGAKLGEGKGKLYIVNAKRGNRHVIEAFPEKSADNQILSLLSELVEQHPETKTVLITKDINLRMKARSLGLIAEDYINDKVTNVDIFEHGEMIVEGINPDLIDKIYANNAGVSLEEFDFNFQIEPNQCLILKSERNSALIRYNPFSDTIGRVEKSSNFGIHPRNAEQTFALEVLNDPKIKLVGLTGKAGTGKTLLALAAALKQHRTYNQILLARPIVALSNKDMGFLPGDEKPFKLLLELMPDIFGENWRLFR